MIDNIYIFRVFHSDRLSDQQIGLVTVDLSILINKLSIYNNYKPIHGWYPIYNCFEGIRGELYISINFEPKESVLLYINSLILLHFFIHLH